MVRTKVSVCNVALGHIGDRTIKRLDSEAQEEDALVRYCADFYDTALDELLERHRWSFAKRDRAMNTAAAPLLRYDYAHTIPSDCLRLMSVHKGTSDGADPETITYNDTPLKRFKKVGNVIQSNSEILAAHYIFREDSPENWSASFTVALGYLLASYLAGPVADDPGREAQIREMCEQYIIPNAQYYDSVQDESGENDDMRVRRAESQLLAARTHEGLGPIYDPEDYDGYNYV